MSVGLSVVIITWNQYGVLSRCLSSLNEVMRRDDAEIIVVDNGSTDGTTEKLKKEFPGLKLIANDCNKGVAYARNRGIEIAKGDKILILDNDTIVNSEAIEGMEKYLDENPQMGICGCKLMDGEGNVQKSCKEYPGLGVKLRNIMGLGSDISESIGDEPVEPVYLIGACQMIRRQVVDQIGLLDEKIFYGPEDADYCIRAAKAGWKVIYLPGYSIIHLWRRATRKNIFSPLSRKHIKALLYFYFKHKRLF